MTLANVNIDDKFALETGRIFLTGIQALVRLPMMQRQRDLGTGLNTAGFISGYRGSPLGNLDQALWKAKPFLEKNHIRFQPGVNEDLAATAVWGSQQTNLFSGAKYDGVFAMWYGKGPGVDRSMDVFKHANAAGSARHGGVLLVAGDDHAAKSSTLPHQSEQVFTRDCRYTLDDAMEASGLDEEFIRRDLLALGLSYPERDERIYSEAVETHIGGWLLPLTRNLRTIHLIEFLEHGLRLLLTPQFGVVAAQQEIGLLHPRLKPQRSLQLGNGSFKLAPLK